MEELAGEGAGHIRHHSVGNASSDPLDSIIAHARQAGQPNRTRARPQRTSDTKGVERMQRSLGVLVLEES